MFISWPQIALIAFVIVWEHAILFIIIKQSTIYESEGTLKQNLSRSFFSSKWSFGAKIAELVFNLKLSFCQWLIIIILSWQAGSNRSHATYVYFSNNWHLGFDVKAIAMVAKGSWFKPGCCSNVSTSSESLLNGQMLNQIASLGSCL